MPGPPRRDGFELTTHAHVLHIYQQGVYMQRKKRGEGGSSERKGVTLFKASSFSSPSRPRQSWSNSNSSPCSSSGSSAVWSLSSYSRPQASSDRSMVGSLVGGPDESRVGFAFGLVVFFGNRLSDLGVCRYVLQRMIIGG
jgi:hypothetical protein